ncbi:MAG: hypothetical protein BroJett040_00280 [Oligoflexia bacterium]|nr:MAG: hypothetical protein BroJett040_00280 [Oligoflexia bacterium]
MKKMNLVKFGLTAMSAVALSTVFTACGGGGGGGGGSGSVLYYPFETVYGDVCTTMEATPGCTFDRITGDRITVSRDPDYNRTGYGSDDLWFVQFFADGTADVYDQYGFYQYTASTSSFAGWVGGNTIGVGTTGLFWENVAGGTYWLGKNGVLYNANPGEGNYGQAINDQNADDASDTNFAAIQSETNEKLVKAGADKLMKEYGFKEDKARAVASALNSWAVSSAERGFTTDKDMDKTFQSVFGVEFSSALAAVKDLQSGNKASMKALTNRTAAELGLTPSQAQNFIKGMYKKALANWGLDADNFVW